MRDLVEYVIDNLLAQERIQRPAREARASAGKQRFAQTLEAIQRRTPPRQEASPYRNEHADRELWQACLRFEGLFIQQMMAVMRKSIPRSGFPAHGFAEDVHDAMMDQAIAEAASARGELGIAEMIYRQMSHAGAQEHPASADKEKSMAGLPGRGEPTREVNQDAR